jgi:hypothetical protein
MFVNAGFPLKKLGELAQVHLCLMDIRRLWLTLENRTDAVNSVAFVRLCVPFAEEDVAQVRAAVVARDLALSHRAAHVHVTPVPRVEAVRITVPARVLELACGGVEREVAALAGEVALFREEGAELAAAIGFRATLAQAGVLFVRQLLPPLRVREPEGVRIRNGSVRHGRRAD